MMNEQSKREKEQLQRALDALNQVETRAKVLLSSQECGMTTQELAELESGEGYRPVYSVLSWLISPGQGLLPLLNSIPMRMIDKEGRPPKAYVLTEFGAQALRLLDPQSGAHALELKDTEAWQHRFVQAQIYTQARKMKWNAEVEKVLGYGQGKDRIRCDVLIQRPGKRVHVEIEQELPRNNLWRAVEKFERWREYAKSQKGQVDLLFVFNLSVNDAQDTLQNWQEALGRVEEDGKLNCRISYLLVADLHEKDLAAALGVVKPLTPLKVEAEEASVPAALAEEVEFAEEMPEYVDRLYHGYVDSVVAVYRADTPKDQLTAFFNLALYIYEASYYRDSDAENFAALPQASIWLLRNYLHLPANREMFDELKQALNWMQKRSGQMGMIMFRDNMTRILWDVFLRHHGFSRGGALNVMFYIPDFQDIRSDLWVKVVFSDGMFSSKLGLWEWRIKEACEAVSWMLTALFSYSEELELGQRPWKQIAKKIIKRKGRR